MKATRYNWSDAEVEEAAQHVRSKRPDVWSKLEELERESGDLEGEEAADVETGLLLQLHPELDLFAIASLQVRLRVKRGHS